MNVDTNKLKRAIHETVTDIRELKAQIRATDRPGRLWRDLFDLKEQATLQCAIAAHRRGRLHLRKCTKSHFHLGLPVLEVMTMDHQVRFIGERWKAYACDPGS